MAEAGAPSGSWGKIEAPGFSYQLTDDDIIWVARSLTGEGGPVQRDPAAILWTYAQRMVWRDQRGNPHPTFAQMVQLHSQPINPRWFRSAPDSKCHLRPEACSDRKEALRHRRRSLRWDQISPELRQIVERWATGNLPNPVPRSVDFANSPVTATFIRNNPGSVYVQPEGFEGGERGTCPDPPCNYFVAERDSKSWPANLVKITGGEIGTVMGVGIIIAAIALAGAVGVYFGLRE
jgi:hypothetical protein